MESDPRKLLERLFGQGDTPAERRAISKQYSSILDAIAGEARDLEKTLDPQDRGALADYLDSVREIERRVEKLEAQDLSNLAVPDVPIGPSYDQRLNLMFDLLALAYEANLTRVFTFMMAAEASNMTYNHIGVSDAFHPLSHHQNDKAKMERLVRIQTYHSQAFAKFLAKLAKTPDGDGTLLDHSILLYGSNMSNSNAHDEFLLPLLLLGGGCGKLKGNQHLRTPTEHRWRTCSPPCSTGPACRSRRWATPPARSRRCDGRSRARTAPGGGVAGGRRQGGRRAAVARAIQQRADVNAAEPDGTTALHWAVIRAEPRWCGRCCAPARRQAHETATARPRCRRRQRSETRTSSACSWRPARIPSPQRGRPDRADAGGAHRQPRGRQAPPVTGAQVNARERWREQTALMWAVAQRQPEMVGELLATGPTRMPCPR